MDTKKLSGLAALTIAFGLGACSHTTVETPTPATSTGATVTTTTTASTDTTTKRDSAAGYQASGTTTTSTSVTTPSTTTTVTTPSTTVTATANGAQTLAFTSLNNSGFTGNVTLTDMGDHTRIAVTLNSPANTNASADHNVAIHTGTCASPGAKVKGLSDVEGNGNASNSDVEMRMSELTDGQHIIVVNENPGDRAVACVAIPSK